MHTFTVTLTDAELKALEYVAFSAQEWIDKVVHNQCRLAMEDIFQMEVQRMLADPNVKEIPADREMVVLAANIKSGAERNAEVSSSMNVEEPPS